MKKKRRFRKPKHLLIYISDREYKYQEYKVISSVNSLKELLVIKKFYENDEKWKEKGIFIIYTLEEKKRTRRKVIPMPLAI